MLSVIIATLDSERALASTLAALVSGATAGLISEVLVADGGSSDETAVVADVAGCNFIAGGRPRAPRLKAGADAARAPWLMFLRPGTVLDAAWISEAARFVEQAPAYHRAAAFRRGASSEPPLRQALLLLRAALSGRPRPEQGLIISRAFYAELGGHSERVADPEAELLRRIGKHRLVILSAGASTARPYT
jgi:glycosyltransferase involved in cell wall biosynthesis